MSGWQETCAGASNLVKVARFYKWQGDVPLDVTLTMLLTVCPLVFFASFVDAIAGGGGLISLPAYSLAGVPKLYLSGSNKFSACFGTLMATIRFLKSGKLLLLPGLLAVAGALPGSYLGAELYKRTPEVFVRWFMIVAIPLVALIMMLRLNAPAQLKPLSRARLFACFLIGLGCGGYDGFFGPGTGVFLIMLFTYVVGMDMVTASGTAKLVNLASNLAALVSFARDGQILYQLALPAMACSVIGGFLGASMAVKVGAKLVRSAMLFVLALLIFKMAWDFFH